MRNDKPWVIFDLDDVVYNFREQWLNSFKAEGIELPHWSKWKNYSDLNFFKMGSQSELQKIFIKHECIERATVEQDALSSMRDLKDAGFMIGALTARSWHPEAREHTLASFKRDGLPIDQLEISGFHHDLKSASIHKFAGGKNIFAFIDDSKHHVDDFLNNGIENSYLMSRPWNKQFHNDTNNVESINQFTSHIIEIKTNHRADILMDIKHKM